MIPKFMRWVKKHLTLRPLWVHSSVCVLSLRQLLGRRRLRDGVAERRLPGLGDELLDLCFGTVDGIGGCELLIGRDHLHIGDADKAQYSGEVGRGEIDRAVHRDSA